MEDVSYVSDIGVRNAQKVPVGVRHVDLRISNSELEFLPEL